MKTNLRLAVAAIVLSSGAACLRTRSDVKEVEQQKAVTHQVVTLQKENADVSSRYNDLNEEIRDLRGRIEVAENKISKGDSENDRSTKNALEQTQDVGKKTALLQETVTRLDSQVQALNAEVQALRADIAASNARQIAPSGGGKNSWENGLENFDKKDWKKAILAFQDYREKNPKGKNFHEATYRIGVCFQELGLKDEAKTFYDEVISKNPDSSEAKKAKIRLKSLKSTKK